MKLFTKIREAWDPLMLVIIIPIIVVFLVGTLVLEPIVEKRKRARVLVRVTAWCTAYDKGFIDGMHATLKHAPIPKDSEIDFAPILKEMRAAERFKEKQQEKNQKPNGNR